MTVFASFEKRNESGSNTNMYSDFKVSVIYINSKRSYLANLLKFSPTKAQSNL